MITDISMDHKSGIPPSSITSFEQLHDYVDANCNGYCVEFPEALSDKYTVTYEGSSATLETMVTSMNFAIEIVNKHLVNGVDKLA